MMTTIDQLSESINERINRIRQTINNRNEVVVNQPTTVNTTPQQINDLCKKLEEINIHYKPRCDSMEEFLENEAMKEQAYASFFNDKYREHYNRKEEIKELLSLWRNDLIDVDNIREELKKL